MKRAWLWLLLKLLSWNIYGGRIGMTKVVNVLNASQADIYYSGADDPARQLRAAFPQWSLARGGSRGELVILSRRPLTGRREAHLGRGRPCLLAELEGVTLIDVHFSTALGGRSLSTSRGQYLKYLAHTSAIRSEQTDALLKLMKAIPGPLVVAGDFNSLPTMDPPTRLSTVLRPVTTGPTYFGWRIDYIFASPALAPKDGQVVETSASDHLPITATLDLR